jgi:hypothetical protein
VDNTSSDGSFPGEVDSAEPDSAQPDFGQPNTPESPAQQRVAESTNRHKSSSLIHALAGLQAGIVGVIWMYACFVAAALWGDGSIWSVSNLFSTLFYGDYAYQSEFLRTTWGGAALIVVLYGLIGAVWGCIWKDRRRPLLSVYGALTGLGVYYFFFNFVWTHADPLIPLYAPVRQLQVAHILWGAALAKSPVYSARIAAAVNPTGVTRDTGNGGDAPQEEAAIVSGELIQ